MTSPHPEWTIGYARLQLMSGLSKRTLERYKSDGTIPRTAVIKYARGVRFRLGEIEKWLASRTGTEFSEAVKDAAKEQR